MKKDRWYFSYACALSNSVLKIKAKPNANTTFRNGRKVLETIYVFMAEDAETLNDVDKQDAVSGYNYLFFDGNIKSILLLIIAS